MQLGNITEEGLQAQCLEVWMSVLYVLLTDELVPLPWAPGQYLSLWRIRNERSPNPNVISDICCLFGRQNL